MTAPVLPRRILVALHGAHSPDRALGQAAALAAELNGELACLFLEDQALFDLCGLPSIEVAGATGSMRRPDAASLERELRAKAESARVRVSRAALEIQAPWSFAIWRGKPRDALFEASRTAEVVVAGNAVVRASLVGRAADRDKRIVVLLEGGAGEGATLRIALAVARRLRAPATALVAASRPHAMAFDAARRDGDAVDFRALAPGPEALDRALVEHAPTLLVLDAQGLSARPEMLFRMLALADCDVAFVTPR